MSFNPSRVCLSKFLKLEKPVWGSCWGLQVIATCYGDKITKTEKFEFGFAENIEILKRDKILEHVREIEPYFFEKLNKLYELPIVGDIRGKGMMAGIECVINKDSKEALVLDQAIGSRIDEESIKLGLIIRPLYHICVLSPALIITKNQIDDLTEKLYLAISNTIDQLQKEGLWSSQK